MFRPYMAIIRFFALNVSLYKLREKGCDVEISHQAYSNYNLMGDLHIATRFTQFT